MEDICFSEEKKNAIAENCLSTAWSGEHGVLYGIAVNLTDLRAWPTEEIVTDERGDINFDYAQLSSVRVNEPMILRSMSADGCYYYGYTNNCSGWVLAEDIAVNAEIMKMVLSMKEIESDTAENGRIAVDKYVEHPEGYYDAILMDMRMPEMDGLEATRAIRASGRKDAETIPIIALTANAFDEDVQRSMQAGLNAHLSKPVEPEVLFDTLESLIGAVESKAAEGNETEG